MRIEILCRNILLLLRDNINVSSAIEIQFNRENQFLALFLFKEENDSFQREIKASAGVCSAV